MSKFDLAEAGTRLPELVERARRGEGVVITSDGAPVAEIRPLVQPDRQPRKSVEDDLAWLRARRVTPLKQIDSSVDVSQMRDEDWH